MKEKIVVLGDGYLGSAYRDAGYDCIGREVFRYDSGNFSDLKKLIAPYDIVINCMGKTDTRWSEEKKHFRELWWVNAHLVKELSDHCRDTYKRFVHLSTADLYGNVAHLANMTGDVLKYAYDQTAETATKMDIDTNYRFSKLGGEKFCNDEDLILRIRLPFDGREHPKNLLCKARNFTRFYEYQNTFTYVPDLLNATKALLENNQTGIFNVVQYESASILYLMRNILQLPELQKIDMHNKEDPNLITQLSSLNIHNDTNTDKLRQFFKQVPLEAAWMVSWEKLKIAVDKV